MKRFLVTTVALGVLSLPAMAADMNPAPAYRAPVPVPIIPVFTWTGCYIGGTVGGVWGSSDDNWAANPASFLTPAGASAINSQTASTITSSGVIGGVEGGCNYQVSPWFVVGLEGDWQGTGLSGSTNGTVNFIGTSNPWTESWSSHWLATIRGRAGYAAGPWLFYVTGGGAFANVSFSDAISFPGTGTSNAFSQSSTASGWTIGGGVEWAFLQNWTVKAEYLYVDIPGTSFTSANSNPAAFSASTINHTHGDLTENIVRVGVNYKFW
jgi:outer membrane immunogenic protein